MMRKDGNATHNHQNHLAIFDLDGTLFETHSITVPATVKALTDMGLSSVPESKICSMIGATWSDFTANLAPELSKKERRTLASYISKYEKEFLGAKGRLYPGTSDMVKGLLDQGITLSICSNGSIDYIEKVLTAFSLISCFDHILSCSTELTKSEAVAQLLTKANAQRAIVVGDRLEDIEAAQVNGCTSVGACYGYGQDEVGHADYIANSSEEVLYAILMWRVFSVIEHCIIEWKKPSWPTIVGINGVDLSGKSTLATSFQDYLRKRGYNVELIHLDDFHNPSAKRREGGNPIDAYLRNAFNTSLLESEVLGPIAETGRLSTTLTLLDLETDTYSNHQRYDVCENTIVLLEGVLLFRPPVDNYIDLRVFLDIGFDEVLKRAKSRDVARFGAEILPAYRNKYIPLQKKYLREYSPKQTADIVIDNEDFMQPRLISMKASEIL